MTRVGRNLRRKMPITNRNLDDKINGLSLRVDKVELTMDRFSAHLQAIHDAQSEAKGAAKVFGWASSLLAAVAAAVGIYAALRGR